MKENSVKALFDHLVSESKFASNSKTFYANHSPSDSKSILITYNQVFRNTLSLSISLVLIAVFFFIPVSFAAGGSSPNDFSKVGASWVYVPESEKVYFEHFNSSWDDHGIGYLNSGVVCTDNGVSVTGPALITASPIDVTDCPTTFDKIPLPFAMNFYGTTYTETYITTNGNLTFDSSSGAYNRSGFNYSIDNGPTSTISPLSLDLYYDYTDSNIWFAPRTLNGKNAFVVSWEDMHTCCDDFDDNDLGDRASFQLVIIENGVGTGNFEAWFNFDKFEVDDQGYGAPTTYIDLNSGVTVGSNKFVVKQVSGISTSPTDCTEYDIDERYNVAFWNEVNEDYLDWDRTEGLPGGLFPQSTIYLRLFDSSSNKVEIFTDNLCSVPWTPTSVGDLGTYIQITDDSEPIDSVNVGWSGFRASNNTIEATEFFANQSADELVDGGTDPLIEKSLNTTVVGRFVLFMSGGETFGDPDSGPGIDEIEGGSGNSQVWVGEVATTCSEINPSEKEFLETANNVIPRKSDSKNLVGNYITQDNLDNLGKSNVIFDAAANQVKTATAVLPDLGCSDHWVKVKINKPIQFIVGGFKLQSNAQGYIQTPEGTWHNLSSTTLTEDTAAFLHTVQFAKKGTYLVVITQQPAFSEGMPLPVLGINSARFKVEVSNKK